MKKETFTELPLGDLRERLAEMEREYRQLVVNHSVSPLDSPAKITAARKAIARAKTELRRRELAANK